MTPHRKTAALYLRISQSDDASTSLTRQEADLRARADREGWEVTHVLMDDGFSGGVDRDNARRALALLADGTVDVLAVWKWDRFSRQGIRAVGDLLGALDRRNGDALFVADRDGLTSDQSAWGIIAAVLAETAKMERANIALRVTSSIAELRRTDRYSGGNLPYGYGTAPHPAGAGRVLVVDPQEATIVRDAASAVLAGSSLYAVATHMNRRGVAPRRTSTWTVQALRQVLTGDAIIGRVRHRGDFLRDEDGLPRTVWEPVLDAATWHALRGRLVRSPTASKRGGRRARLLSGLVHCGECRALLYVRHNGHGSVSYGCSARSNGKQCRGVSVSALPLEEYVVTTFLEAAGGLPHMERHEQRSDADLHLAEVERALDEAYAAHRDATTREDEEEVTRRIEALKARRLALRAESTVPVVTLALSGRSVAEEWERASEDERRNLLAANVAVLSILKGQKGAHGLDPRRVTLVAQPSHSQVAPGTSWTAGRVPAVD